MADVLVGLTYMDKVFEIVFSVINPVLNLFMFVLIMGFTFIILRLFFKMYLLFRLVYGILRDSWIKYNKNDLGLEAYAKHQTTYRYDLEGWRHITALFKEATSFW
jgi:hypothetical protein